VLAARVVRREALAFALVALGVWAACYFWAPLTFAAQPVLGWAWASGAVCAALSVRVLRELHRDTFSSFASIRKRAGYSVLGGAPLLTARDLRDLPPDQRSPMGYIIHKPSSPFAQSARELQLAVADKPVVAFIGAVANEGATTSALCAAASAAQQGLSVIVLDCDLRRRSLTQALGVEPRRGVLEAAASPESWRDFVLEEPETGLHFIPAAAPDSPWRALLETPGFATLIARLRENYDHVILDCPPALAAADGPVIARGADQSVIVMAWDETPLRALRDTQRAFRTRGPKVSDVYVNRMPRLVIEAAQHNGRHAAIVAQ